MACTAVDVLQDDVLLARAKVDHQARVGRTPYVCPLPDELDPPLVQCSDEIEQRGLPDPDGPPNSATSPCDKSNDTSSSAVICLSPRR